MKSAPVHRCRVYRTPWAGAAEPIVDTLFGTKWTASIGPLAVFGVWAAIKRMIAASLMLCR